MKIAIPRERRKDEARVAASPDTAKRMVAMGLEVAVETGAGAGSAFPDSAYQTVGASIAPDQAAAFAGADIVLKVQRPLLEGGVDELAGMKQGAVLIGMLQPLQHPQEVAAYARAGIAAFAMELIPRITRAQSMDVLSSQAERVG
jgi:H+-translocating NAD(P) transhydrogenase subunit alpha